MTYRDRDKPRQGVVANTLVVIRLGAVGFIDWLVWSSNPSAEIEKQNCDTVDETMGKEVRP
jgi:hypothetical protein